MKKLIFITFLINTTIIYAQKKDTIGLNLPIINDRLVYEQVIDVPDKTKSQLFSNAKVWMANTFVSSKDVIQSEDKEAGNIIGKGFTKVYFKSMVTIERNDYFTIQIDVKDNKYRYKIHDITVTSDGADLGGSFGSVPKTSFTDDQLIGKLLGKNGLGIYGLTKNQIRNLLSSIDAKTKEIMVSLKEAMNKKVDAF